MTTISETGGRGLARSKRMMLWGVIATLLCMPAVAMRLTNDVAWTATDFVFAGVVLIGAGILFEVAMAALRTPFYRILAGVGILGLVVTVWAGAVSGLI